MNRCPSCRTLVPASWIACRRCGGALPVARPNGGEPVPRAGAIALRSRPAGAGTAVAPPARASAASPEGTRAARFGTTGSPTFPDTLLPGRAPDTLLPAPRTDLARRRRLAALAVVGAALAIAGWSAARVVFANREPAPPTVSAERRARAEKVLRDTADAARTVFMQRGTYEGIAAATVADRTRGITVVDAETNARNGQVSLGADGDALLVLATPAGGGACVFARDDPTGPTLMFAVAAKKPCQASAAPRAGWASE